jgi:hypothetical protein
MDEKIGLTRGNPDNLEGRVLFYARVKTHSDDAISNDTQIVAMYISPDVLDVLEKTHMDQKSIIDIKNQIDEAEKEAMEEAGEPNYDPAKAKHMYRSLALILSISTDDQLEEGTNDVWYLGSFNYPQTALSALQASKISYFALFRDQQEQTKSEEQNPKKGPKTPEDIINQEPQASHTDFAGQDIYPFVMQTYITQLLDAKKYQEPNRFENTKRQLAIFGSFSRFDVYTSKLAAYIEKTEKPNLEVVDAYAKLMSALHTEAYEDARKQKTKIDQLS